MKHPEQKLHFAVADYLNLTLPPDAWWTTVGHGGFALDARTGARMKRAGVKAGVPDILIVHRGRPLFIELKSTNGRASAEQKTVAADLEKAGARYAICHSLEQVAWALSVWNMPMRAEVAA